MCVYRVCASCVGVGVVRTGQPDDVVPVADRLDGEELRPGVEPRKGSETAAEGQGKAVEGQ